MEGSTVALTHESIAPYVEKGLVRRQTKGNLSIYSYTQSCQYSRAWDPITTACRGLIIHDSGEIYARPFPKFFNLGEPSCPPLPDLPYDVYEKMDGSLLITFWNVEKQEFDFATRGSFDNQYIDYAKRWRQENRDPIWGDPFGKFWLGWTFLFEVIPPPEQDGMPRVVQHRPGLYLLGAVDHHGNDVDPKEVQNLWRYDYADTVNAKLPKLIAAAESEKGIEGWVVRYENGFRVKIKTGWYLNLFRAINNLTERHIRELLAANTSALISSSHIIKQFPEEFRAEADLIVTAVIDGVNDRHAEILKQFDEAKKYYTTDGGRKGFALRIKDNPNKGYLFALLDGKPILKQLILDESRVYYHGADSTTSDVRGDVGLCTDHS